METKQKLRSRETSSPTGPSLEIRTSVWLQNGRAKQNEQEVINKWLFPGKCDKTSDSLHSRLACSECNWDSLQKGECGGIYRAQITYGQ